MIIINQYRNQQLPDYILKEYWGELYFDEIFVPITKLAIPELEDENRYIISNYGKIYDIKNKRKVTISKNNNYFSVSIKTINGGISFLLHRLIMCSFYPELGNIHNKLFINHKNGNTKDSHISYNNPKNGNIEWVTPSYNNLHAYKIGLNKIGEDNSLTKASNEEVQKIIELLSLDPNKNVYTAKEIVNIVGGNVNEGLVNRIRNNSTWKHMSKGYEFYHKPRELFTKQDIHNFCKFFQDNPKPFNMHIKDQCRRALIAYGFEPSERYVETLRKVYTKKYYSEIVSQYNF